ncbi:MAG: CsbD family protein [Bryobacteraceae bacterium]
MNWDQVEGQWKQMKGSLKQRWGKLTDDDLTVLSGKRDELVGKVQERYGITREQAQQQVDEWATAADAKTQSFSASASKKI